MPRWGTVKGHVDCGYAPPGVERSTPGTKVWPISAQSRLLSVLMVRVTVGPQSRASSGWPTRLPADGQISPPAYRSYCDCLTSAAGLASNRQGQIKHNVEVLMSTLQLLSAADVSRAWRDADFLCELEAAGYVVPPNPAGLIEMALDMPHETPFGPMVMTGQSCIDSSSPACQSTNCSRYRQGTRCVC